MTASIPKAVAESAGRSVLCWLATVDNSGQPNVSPKEAFSVYDENHLVIANVASPHSVRNVTLNAKVCVSFVDIFVQKGFKLTGTANNIPKEHREFSQWAAPLQQLTQGRFPIQSVIVVKVLVAEPIVAPSYWLFPTEVTEQSQVEAAMGTYGVQPL
ncbi:MAG: pyridoxamine 5'-phosphate oxidase family protein [Cyanobacteria bacterium J06638_6]